VNTYIVTIKTKEIGIQGTTFYNFNTLTLRADNFIIVYQLACNVMETAFTSEQEARVTEIRIV